MTLLKEKRNTRYILFVIAIFSIVLSLIYPKFLISFALNGLNLCFQSIIPSLFPFLIFSDMLICSRFFENIPNFIGKYFEKIFRINRAALGAFCVGILCGFPLGVKYTVDLYKNGTLSKEESERLLCYANNTGPAFVIAGIGVAMRGSVLDGIILYLIQVFSAIICGLVLSINHSNNFNNQMLSISEKNFSLSQSIKTAAANMVYISGFVTFFSIISGFLNIFSTSETFTAFLSIFLEVGNSAALCSHLNNRMMSFSLSAAAISFSGFSVHMQSRVFIDGTDLKTNKYYLYKLLQSIFSFFVASIIMRIKLWME